MLLIVKKHCCVGYVLLLLKELSTFQQMLYEGIPCFPTPWLLLLNEVGIPGVQYHIQCSGSAIVYLDGDKMGETADSNIWTSIAPRTVRLIAIQCTGVEEANWISESFSGSKMWKCTRHVVDNNWTSIDFEDTTWEKATLYDSVDDGIFANASRIWTNDRGGNKIFCRGRIGMTIISAVAASADKVFYPNKCY